MKKTLLFIAMMLCCATTIFAQNNKISYQAVVRDTENKLVANKDVNVTVTITDADNHSFTQEFTDVQTNFNGMLSLMIGPDGENADWNNIHWNHAKVETTVTLAGVELGTLTMPLTAVPYALYADNINPDGAVAQAITEKMKADSIALGALIDANAADIENLEEMDEDLAERIAADSARLVDFKKKMKADSAALKELVDANITAINELKTVDAGLNQRIVADSNRLVALKNRVNTFNTHICDSVLACGVIKDMRDSIQTNATAIATKANTSYVDEQLALKANAADVYTKTQINENIDSVKGNLRTEIAAKANTSYVDGQLALKANAADVYTKAQVNENIDSVKGNLRTEIAAKANSADVYTKDQVYTKAEIDALLQNLPKMGQQVFTADAEQTTFELSNAPKAGCIFRMYINGVMVGGSHNGVLVPVANEANKVEYDGTKNGNYMLKANDKVTIVYWY